MGNPTTHSIRYRFEVSNMHAALYEADTPYTLPRMSRHPSLKGGHNLKPILEMSNRQS